MRLFINLKDFHTLSNETKKNVVSQMGDIIAIDEKRIRKQIDRELSRSIYRSTFTFTFDVCVT